MLSVAPAAALGLLVGLRHALDADHVAAVGAIVARERTLRGAALVGAAWGVGHALSLFLFGGAIVAFGVVVPPRVALGLELAVGVMLVGLGIWSWIARPHHHNGTEKAEPADGRADGPSAPAVNDSSPLRRALRPLVVGSVHGLAGSAAAALLVVAAATGASVRLAYLLVLCGGTLLGMVALTTALALPIRRAVIHSRRAEPALRVVAGAMSLAVGALVIYQIGVRDGLFL